MIKEENEYSMSLFHITHWKAGSQWIYNILKQAAPENMLSSQGEMKSLSKDHPAPGKIYPPLYVTYQQFIRTHTQPHQKRLVIIRDLRDTLISSYFSLKISHVNTDPWLEDVRKWLNELNTIEDGLIFLINHWLHTCAVIQHSWLEISEPLIHYEDLRDNDIEILTPLFKGFFTHSEKEIKKIIIANRFETISHHRKPSDEDIKFHARKAVAGDWKNYFSERVKQAFKRRFDDLLVRTGYESNHNW